MLLTLNGCLPMDPKDIHGNGKTPASFSISTQIPGAEPVHTRKYEDVTLQTKKSGKLFLSHHVQQTKLNFKRAYVSILHL